VVFYPNICPIEFGSSAKDAQPSISIVLRGHWGRRVEKSLEDILRAIAHIDGGLRVYLIGIKPAWVPKNILLQHFDCIPDKLDYFKLLSKSWVGINIGVHKGGTNQRKYDYAMVN
jgi:hypothetical protein